MKKKILIKTFSQKISLPKNFDKRDNHLFKDVLFFKIPNLYSYHYKNICINNDLYLWKNFKFLGETYLYRKEIKRLSFSKIKFLLKQKTKKKTKIKNALWIIDKWSHVYYHWFFDVLQKQLCDKSEYPVLLPENFLEIDYIKQTLKYLNINFITIKDKEVVKVKNLFSIPTVHFSGFFITKKIIKLRNLFLKLDLQNFKKHTRIYISRKKAVRRKISNETEVVKFLKSINFKILYLEDLSWTKQLTVFSSANTLLTIHGSGLTNMLFMKENANIVEIRHPASHNQNPFFVLANKLKFNYYYLLGNPNLKLAHESDLHIDLTKLKTLVETLNYD